jgi:hypothetical protein
MTDILIKNFDITEDLIKQNPTDENKIINEYNNFIIKTKANNPSFNKSMVRSATFNDNPIDITIHNNFQRYNKNYDDMNYDFNPNANVNDNVNTPVNDNVNDNVNTPTNTPINVNANSNVNPPTATESFTDYFKDLRYGFKDYYPFNY